MKLKMTDDGHAVLQDGKPVYVRDDGSEVAYDAAQTVATITRLNAEAKGHREAKEKAEAALKHFEGLDDPAAARKALETVANLDAKKLIDAGEVERVKAETARALEERYKPALEKAEALERELYAEKIGGAFARSKFIADKLAIPADLAQARFERHFKIEDGKVAAYDASGNRIYSDDNPGAPAEFEEALGKLVAAYPQRDHILKGNPNGGAGTRPSGAPGAKTMTRKQFDTMDPGARAQAIADKVTITD